MPERLLANVDREDESDEFALKYPTYLSPMNTILMSWLLDLLLKVVEYKDINLMDPKNCAIVWGPGMTGSADDVAVSSSTTMDMGAMAGLSDTRFGINSIQANVAHLMETKSRPYGVSAVKSGFTATCTVDHPKQISGELELKVGDVVTVVDNSDLEWSFVNHEGKFGFVAKCYIKENKAELPKLGLQRTPSTISVSFCIFVNWIHFELILISNFFCRCNDLRF